MKDPLQTEKAPWEILGIKPDVSRQELDKALMTARRNGVPAHVADQARKDMLDPITRAWWRLLEYPSEALAQLPVNPAHAPSALEPLKRLATASAWETHFIDTYPADYSTAHCLAILFYWGTFHHAQQLANSAKEHGVSRQLDPKMLAETWRGAIAYWAMLIEMPNFWRNGVGISTTEEPVLKQKLRDALQNRLQEQAQQFSGHAAIVAECKELQVALSAELESANAISQYEATMQRGTIRGGLIMLGRLGYLDTMRTLVEERYEQYPNDDKTEKVRAFLSRYLRIDTLIRNNKPDEALVAIKKLSSTEIKSREVSELSARALLVQGKHRAEVGKIQDALVSWQTALKIGNVSKKLKTEIESEVVSSCNSRAAALQQKQLDDAIAILDLGMELVPKSKRLAETLAELLTRRSIATCNEEQKKIEAAQKRGPQAVPAAVKTATPIIEKAVNDLSRAAELGSDRARENVETARQLLNALKSGFANGGGIGQSGKPFPKKLTDLLTKAKDAGEKGNWGAAIGHLREALKVEGFETDDQIQKNLVVCLANHAIDQVNRAIEKLNKEAKDRGNLPEMLADNLKRGSRLHPDSCAMCGKSQYQSSGESWYSFKLPDGTSAPLCEKCKGMIESVLSGPVKPSAEAVRMLRTAQSELEEASRLDPSNEHVEKNLNDVRDVLSKVKADSVSTSSARPSKTGAGYFRRVGFGIKWALIVAVRLSAITAGIAVIGRIFEPDWQKCFLYGGMFAIFFCSSFVFDRPKS